MKGVTFITDETHKKRFVQIDLKALGEYDNRMEDLFDVIMAESRKGEEKIPIEEVRRQLKKAGQL